MPVQAAAPREGTRWIDWYGNLEVSPPVRGFPHGRVLTGEQRGLGFHPGLMAFLEAQELQWPPLVLDVSWLTIGHVDELVNFVPAPGEPGFKVLLPSPRLALDLLREEAKKPGGGDIPVFAGKKGQTTVAALLDEHSRRDETRAIEASLRETRVRLRDGLGVEERDILEMPVLFKDGLAVVPNGVNSLVVGRHVFVPDPCFAPFAATMRDRLRALGLTAHLLDIWEPYHVRSGEIHCGTNAVRRLAHPRWWERKSA